MPARGGQRACSAPWGATIIRPGNRVPDDVRAVFMPRSIEMSYQGVTAIPFAAGQFTQFLLAGGVAAAVNYGSRFLFNVWFSYPAAIVLAYLAGMTTAFILMRQHVFDGRGKPLARQIGFFTLVNMLALAQTLVVSLLLARWLFPAVGVERHAEDIAHLIGVAVPIVTSYFGHRHATFK